MHGFEYFKAINGSIDSGATYGTWAQILGAEIINIKISTANTAHALTVQVSDTYTTAQFLPLLGDVGAGSLSSTVGLGTSVGGCILDLGHLGCGMKYMRLMSDIALVDGQSITIYNIR